MRVAVVGAGISGLAAAHELARSGAHVVVYEKEDYLGGHAKTVAVDGVELDLGFMVFNRVTYPNMMEFFERLGVEMEVSDMSFAVSLEGGKGIEWGSRSGLSSLLAQKSNALNPFFWNMIREIVKFKEDVLKYLEDHENNPDLDRNETLGQFIQSHGYSQLFQKAYLIPICACIWSCPSEGVLGFSAFFVLSFCRNHHLLQLFGRPQWLTVKGRSHSYVNKVREELESLGCQTKTSCAVKSVSSFPEGCRVLAVDDSEEIYDRCIIGVHAPDALKILGTEATYEELRILGAFQYVYSDIYLHCDKNLMPRNSSAWSAWNFLGTTSNGVCVTYWLNVLQNIKSTRPFLVTLNPPRVPDHVLLKWYTSHPVPSVAAAKASLELDQIQGKRAIWFCGAYQGTITRRTLFYTTAGHHLPLGLHPRCRSVSAPSVAIPPGAVAGRVMPPVFGTGPLSLTAGPSRPPAPPRLTPIDAATLPRSVPHPDQPSRLPAPPRLTPVGAATLP